MNGIDLLNGYYAAYNRGDEGVMRALLAPTVTIVPADGAEEKAGVEPYLAAWRRSRALFEDTMEPQAMAQHGDLVTVDLRNRLTARQDVADFFGMAVRRGETLDLRLVARYTIRHGRIAAIRISASG